MRNDRRFKLIRLSQAAGSVVDDVEFFPGPGRRTVGEQRGGTGAFGAEVAARAGAAARIGAAKAGATPSPPDIPSAARSAATVRTELRRSRRPGRESPIPESGRPRPYCSGLDVPQFHQRSVLSAASALPSSVQQHLLGQTGVKCIQTVFMTFK